LIRSPAAVILNAVRKEPGSAAGFLLFIFGYSCLPALAQDGLSFDATNFTSTKNRSNSAITVGANAGVNVGADAAAGDRPTQVFNVPHFELRGKVEAKDNTELLLRPIAGYDALGRSVKVLSGSATALQGRVEDQTLDGMLKNDNFKLQQMNARSDFANDGIARMGNMMSNGFSWGIGEGGGIRMWEGWRDLGAGNGNANWQPDWSASAGDPTFDQRRVQSNMSWANEFRPRGSLMPDGSRNAIAWSIAGAQTLPRIEEQQIVWDAWYQNISKALYAHWKNPGEHPGKATLRITVQRQRKIQAQMIGSTNQLPSFRASLLAAVQSLAGNSVLDFPQQSAKTTVSFDSVFSAGLDTVNGAFSDRHNETEPITLRRH